MELTERVMAAKTDESVFTELIREYTPMIRAEIVKKTYAPGLIDRDELISVGFIAFYEAVRNYDPARGAFIPYARRIIENRVIDEYRKTGTIAVADADLEIIIEKSSDTGIATEITDEVKQLERELETFRITLEDVNRGAPKHKRARAELRGLVAWMLRKPEIADCVLTKKYMPMALLEQYGKLSRKALDKRRRYLVACVLVASGDYVYLREYLNL